MDRLIGYIDSRQPARTANCTTCIVTPCCRAARPEVPLPTAAQASRSGQSDPMELETT